jgi:hypothetical protein
MKLNITNVVSIFVLSIIFLSVPHASARLMVDWKMTADHETVTAQTSGGNPMIDPTSYANEDPDQVLEWNQIFVDTLIATNTANSSSQRLGAIVHTAIFDAYNGIERRYSPIYYSSEAPRGASRRAAVIAAGYTTLANLFPSRQTQLQANYEAALEALSDDEGDGGKSVERGIAWGTEVAQAVLAWRATDGFNQSYPTFAGGMAIGQWRPTLNANGSPCGTGMSAQPLAFTTPFVIPSREYFRPDSPRGLNTETYVNDFNTVKALGRATGSTRTDDQTFLAPFWEGNASVHWNQAANQIARANHESMSDNSRLFAVLNITMADTAFTIWSSKRFYGADPSALTWRPITAIAFGDDGNPATVEDPTWRPLVNTPCHPEYGAGHPGQNGAAASVLLAHFKDEQIFTLTTGANSRIYNSISQARSDGNNARIWGGMHYPSTIEISDGVGESIANYVESTSMQRLKSE